MVERALCICISSLVYDVQENGAIRDLGGIWSWDWLTNTPYVPVQFYGDCDW